MSETTDSANDYPLHEVALTLCEPCINGVGEECHTPGCDLFLHAVDIPILAAQAQIPRPEQSEVSGGC